MDTPPSFSDIDSGENVQQERSPSDSKPNSNRIAKKISFRHNVKAKPKKGNLKLKPDCIILRQHVIHIVRINRSDIYGRLHENSDDAEFLHGHHQMRINRIRDDPVRGVNG
jgi:hypothetical protein